MNLLQVTLLLLLSYPEWLNCKEIKYDVSQITPEDTEELTQHNKEVVTSKKRAFCIKILNDVSVLRVGMLNVNQEALDFFMSHNNLEEIEPGVFDNQNITRLIDIQHNNLTVIRTGTFKNLTIASLVLDYNKITHIEKNAITNMPNLWNVYLSSNRIAQFNDNAFVNTPSMKIFGIDFNKLDKLNAKWSNFMTKDRRVTFNFSNNKIEEIDPKAFEGLRVLGLYLNNNKLKTIPGELFTECEIRYLDLYNNQLKTLPEDIYNQKNLRTVYVDENPLTCDVQDHLKKYLRKKKRKMPRLSHNIIASYDKKC